MFGYIRPYKPELKVRELETYKAVYCSLCHALGKRYSFLTRMILTYDQTFLALLRLGVSDENVCYIKKRCPAKISKKYCCCITGDIEFAADVAVILFHYKLHDNLSDAGLKKKLAAWFLLHFTSRMHKKAACRLPSVETLVKGYIDEQQNVERQKAGIDQAAHPTADMMSKLFVIALEGRANNRVAERMGYFIGRWVYLADAADDLADDLKNGDFNPFINAYDLKADSELKDARDSIDKLLNMSEYEICAAFELLEIEKFKPILENILYLGLKKTADVVVKGEKLKPL